MSLSADRVSAALAALGLQSSAVISADARASLEQSLGCDTESLMAALVDVVATRAQPSVSKYYVGVVGLGLTGNLYAGVNIEFKNCVISTCVHGEQCMIAVMHAHRDPMVAIAINAPPCGHCRQFINEQHDGLNIRIILGEKRCLLGDLLPSAFGPTHLGVQTTMCRETPLFGPEAISDWAASITSQHSGISRELAQAACAAMTISHSPYSKSPSGVALQTTTGRIVAGSYLECCAYNPSLGPLQAAYAQLAAEGVPVTSVDAIVFVELSSSSFSQRAFVESIAAASFPTAKLVSFIAPSNM